MYVPSHLNHMVFELLKNSLRAVVERFSPDYEDEYPPIRVIIAHGKEVPYTHIKISMKSDN